MNRANEIPGERRDHDGIASIIPGILLPLRIKLRNTADPNPASDVWCCSRWWMSQWHIHTPPSCFHVPSCIWVRLVSSLESSGCVFCKESDTNVECHLATYLEHDTQSPDTRIEVIPTYGRQPNITLNCLVGTGIVHHCLDVCGLCNLVNRRDGHPEGQGEILTISSHSSFFTGNFCGGEE